MDNRLNRIRKEMNALRVEMLRAEDEIRDQVNHDRDCTASAQRLMDRSRTAAIRANSGMTSAVPVPEDLLTDLVRAQG